MKIALRADNEKRNAKDCTFVLPCLHLRPMGDLIKVRATYTYL
jgi:hypothetical protein